MIGPWHDRNSSSCGVTNGEAEPSLFYSSLYSNFWGLEELAKNAGHRV